MEKLDKGASMKRAKAAATREGAKKTAKLQQSISSTTTIHNCGKAPRRLAIAITNHSLQPSTRLRLPSGRVHCKGGVVQHPGKTVTFQHLKPAKEETT